MRRGPTSLLAWLFVCATILTLFLPSYYINKQFIGDRGAPIAAFSLNWQIRFESDSAGRSGEWLTLGDEERGRLSHYRGDFLLKRALPEIPWSTPYLFIYGMNRFEAFLDGRSVYRFHMDSPPASNHFLMTRHPIPISREDQGKELLLRVKWDRMPFQLKSWILAGEPDQVLTLYLQEDAAKYIYSVLYLVVGAVGLVLFARRRDKLYIWFSLLALCAGFGLLLLCTSLQWFANVRGLYFWRDLLLALGIYSFVGLFAEALGAAKRLLFQIAKNTLLLYSAAALIAGLNSATWYWKMLNDGLPWLAVLALGTVSYALVGFPRDDRRPNERKWLVRGYVVLVACAITHMLLNVFAYTIMPKLHLLPYLSLMCANVLPNGLLLFMLAMVMILYHRIGRVYQESERNALELREKNAELEQFHRNLEQLVDVRTAELAEANRSLKVTLREKAETLAEMSVLEERNRIAHEMHDVVGHTLTAAVVQLEASKKIAIRGGDFPLEKLDTINGLVRKGLDDIRKTVRMLKNDDIPAKLETALRELIRETIETMEVAIEAEIDIPRDLGKLTDKIIYHALQEGLTNGIRHAACSWFRYSLRPVGERLEIRLWNDGKPYGFAKPGFGLTTMMERIHLLGGTVSVGSGEDEDGMPVGCELVIVLPLVPSETERMEETG